jgi:hypothetical protein
MTRDNYNLLDYGVVHAIRAIFPCQIASVLDFGAGGGHYSGAFHRVLGAPRVIGVEPHIMSLLYVPPPWDFLQPMRVQALCSRLPTSLLQTIAPTHCRSTLCGQVKCWNTSRTRRTAES